MVPCWPTPNPLQSKSTFLPNAPRFTKEHFGWFPKPRPFTLLLKVTRRTRWIWSTGDTDRGKPNYSGRKLSQSHCIQHKSHMDWPEIELGPPRLTQVIFQDSARTAQSKFRVGYKNWSDGSIVSSQSSTHSLIRSLPRLRNWIKLRNTLNINLY
jgi:hypothetical protein